MDETARERRPLAFVGRLPWHPPVLAGVVVLSFWLDTAVSPYAALRALLVAVLGATLLTLALAGVTRSWVLGGILTTGLLALLWSKRLVAAISDMAGRMEPAIAVLWLVLLAAAGALVLRVGLRTWRRLTITAVGSILNRVAALLLVATILVGALNGSLVDAAVDLRQGVEPDQWAASSDERGDGPDIYAILLDGYPRADVLDYAFGFDNSAFTDALQERGFAVADRSYSDYLWTHVSVPSALNMAYVEQIPAMVDVMEGRSPRQPTLRRTVADNRAFAVAREHGYVTVAVSSGFEEVAARQADVWVDTGQLSEFEQQLMVSTFVGNAVGTILPDFASQQHRGRIEDGLRVLPDIAGQSSWGPRFVFAHVPSPHAPIVFRADGSGLRVPLDEEFYGDSPFERGQSPEEFRAQYPGQLAHLNDLVVEAVDGIIAHSSNPPVIVLFADHGSASRANWNATDASTVDRTILLERTATLFAALTPGEPDVYPDAVSPVNIFRLLYDAYLGTDFGLATPPPDGGQIPPVDASVLDEP